MQHSRMHMFSGQLTEKDKAKTLLISAEKDSEEDLKLLFNGDSNLTAKVVNGVYAQGVFEPDVELENKVIRLLASLYTAGIGLHKLVDVNVMENYRERLRTSLSLEDFEKELESVLGGELETYYKVRDRVQALNALVANLIVSYKPQRRLTNELIKNSSLNTINGIDLTQYFGLTIEQAIIKLEKIIENESVELSNFLVKYEAITEIANKFTAAITLKGTKGLLPNHPNTNLNIDAVVKYTETSRSFVTPWRA